MRETDTIIVGQGIAGSLMAFMLYLKRIPFMVIDPGDANTASRIAAGMFTPITGKRKTIQPMVLQQIPFAVKTYQAIEQLIGCSFLHLENVYQVYNAESEQNDWIAKSAKCTYSELILTTPKRLPNLKQEIGACEINNSGWVDCGLLIKGFADWLNRNGALLQAEFIYTDLQIGKDAMVYQGITFKNIIFCEGYRAVNNPFFKEAIIPCKGDLLTIQCDQAGMNRIIKKNSIYMVEKENGFFKVGSTYHWNNNNAQPDEADKVFLKFQLDALLEKSYSVINHQSATRPTTKNREVIVKQHADIPRMFMLNGMGTRGVLQAPWWSERMMKLFLRGR